MADRKAFPVPARLTRESLDRLLARPAWLRRIERAMRPLDYLRGGVALGAGAAAGAAAGIALGWSGAPWTLGAGAALLAGARWLVVSAEPVAVVERKAKGETLPRPAPSSEHDERAARRVLDQLTMIDLPGGWFWMGSEEGDPGAYSDDTPRHEVYVAPFSMASHTVTQKLYRDVMGQDPGYPEGDDLPANNLSWLHAIAFCNKLSELEGLTPVYHIESSAVTWDGNADGYRLPTEAEWEYACRAGTDTAYSFGDDEARLSDFAWHGESGGDVMPVGHKKSNPWGFYDMHGNVWEWCWDSPEPYPYKNPSPVLPTTGFRALRGGAFYFGPRVLRSASRFRRSSDFHFKYIGFRCVRGPRRQPRSVGR